MPLRGHAVVLFPAVPTDPPLLAFLPYISSHSLTFLHKAQVTDTAVRVQWPSESDSELLSALYADFGQYLSMILVSDACVRRTPGFWKFPRVPSVPQIL